MASFESEVHDVKAPCRKVFDFLSDFRNFENLMPEQIQDWQATETTCSFRIQGVANLHMRIAGKSACRNIHIVSDGANPVEFSLDIFLNKTDDETCRVSVLFDAELSPFMKMMASRPLQSLVEMLSEKIEVHFSS
ncbi:MAG: hypothetical protein R6U86_06050 [Bacteroidales bacterium]